MSDFSNTVNRFERVAKARIRAAAQYAVEDTVEIAQKPVGRGGLMRIDTGFLRASIQAALNTVPRGQSTNDGGYGGKRKYPVGAQIEGMPIAAVILRWDVLSGDRLIIGWTANYARPREYKDGFLRTAVERWDATVEKQARLMEQRIG